MLKIMHCADMHLDTPFSLEDIQISELRRSELRSAFVNMMIYARSNGVQLMLIPGDLFDSSAPTKESLEMVQREFENSRDMKIVIAPGNHDPYSSGSVYERVKFPENVHIFRDNSITRFDFSDLGVSVFGYAFTSQKLSFNPFSQHITADPERINIICGHGDMTRAASDNCPVTLADIRASGADYVALGHIHKGTGVLKEGSVYYAYPGCLEGRDFGETGYKGALIALMDKSGENFAMESRFVRFSRRRYEVEHIDVIGLSDNKEFLSRVDEIIKTKDYSEDTLLRLIAEGESAPAIKINRSALHAQSEKLCYIEVKDLTVPRIDYSELSSDPTIRGAFYEALLPVFRDGTQEERERAEKALRYGLAALADSDIIDF